jgi:hypothetical protein
MIALARRYMSLIAVFTALGAQVALSQETVERDPFSTLAVTEVVRAADSERVSRITREIVETQIAEIERRVILELESRLTSLLDRRLTEFRDRTDEGVDARLSEMAVVVSDLRDELPEMIGQEIERRRLEGDLADPETSLIPEGSVFVACVDGRSLYRDENGSTFYMDVQIGDAGVSRCSN